MLFDWFRVQVTFWLAFWDFSFVKGFSYANDDDVPNYGDDYENIDQYAIDDVTVESDSQATEPSSTLNEVRPKQPEIPVVKEGTRHPPPATGNVYACDKRVDLYILQPERLNTSGMSNPLKGKLTNCHITGCERPFSVQKIPHSNLILLVVDTLCPCGSKQLSISAYEVLYDLNRCRMKPVDALYRRRPPKCINYHPEEVEILLCGNAYRNHLALIAIFFQLVIIVCLT